MKWNNWKHFCNNNNAPLMIDMNHLTNIVMTNKITF